MIVTGSTGQLGRHVIASLKVAKNHNRCAYASRSGNLYLHRKRLVLLGT